MKFHRLYWGIGLLLIGAAEFEYWQHHQAQRQLQWKLRLLDATLQVSNEQTREESESILRKIRWAIERNNQQPRDMVLLYETEEIGQRADESVKFIHALRRDFRQVEPAKGRGSHYADTVAVMYNRANKIVTDYMAFVTPFTMQSTHLAAVKMAFLNVLMPMVDANGSGASIPEFMVMMSQKEATVRANELLALQWESEKIGGGENVIYDKMGAFAAAESNKVAVGEKYKGELFLTSVYGLPVLGMTVNGRPIAVGPDKRGNVEFTVPPAAPGKQAFWTGRIRALVNGQDSTFTVKVPYTVRPN